MVAHLLLRSLCLRIECSSAWFGRDPRRSASRIYCSARSRGGFGMIRRDREWAYVGVRQEMAKVLEVRSAFLLTKILCLLVNENMPEFRSEMMRYSLPNEAFECFLRRNEQNAFRSSIDSSDLRALSNCSGRISVASARCSRRCCAPSGRRNESI